MNGRIGRGLRIVLSDLAESGDGSNSTRPQQFDPSERTPRRRHSARLTEDAIEQDKTPEGERRPASDIRVEPVALRPSARAIALRDQLRDRVSVQRAFLLMELLDKPRALRPYRF